MHRSFEVNESIIRPRPQGILRRPLPRAIRSRRCSEIVLRCITSQPSATGACFSNSAKGRSDAHAHGPLLRMNRFMDECKFWT